MDVFEYLEPKTMGEASAFLTAFGATAQILAGGADLIPRMKKGRVRADCLVNINTIDGLMGFDVTRDHALQFDAQTTLHTMELSRRLQISHPILHQAIHQITSVQSKFMGTAVGNLCVGTPASDVATALMALGGRVIIFGPEGEREVPIEAFYHGYMKTCLKPGELVSGVRVPPMAPHTGASFLNLVRTHADIAKLTTAVALTLTNGVCRQVRIAVGAAAPTVFRATVAENLLRDAKPTAAAFSAAAQAAADATTPITDMRSNAEYRKNMTRVLVKRALAQAAETAGA